jgi:hypothetical protein
MICRVFAIACLLLLSLYPGIAAAERTVVLVTNESCPVSDLSNLDIRKSYLGVSVSVDGYGIRPLRLTADAKLNQVFFQAIVAMSEKSYERRALSLALKFGTPRPEEFVELDNALDALRRTTCAMIFLWESDASSIDDHKTIRVLWRG